MPCCLFSVGSFQWFLCFPCLASHQDLHYNPKVQWFLHFYLPHFIGLSFPFWSTTRAPRTTVSNPIMPESPEGRRNPALKPKPQNLEPAAQDGPSHTCVVTPPQVILTICSPLETLLEASLCPAAKPELSCFLEICFLTSRVESPAIHTSTALFMLDADRNSSLPHSMEDKWLPLFDPIFPVIHFRGHWYPSVDSRLLEEGATACLTLYLP